MCVCAGVPNFRQNKQLSVFPSKFAQNEFRVGNSENSFWNKNQHRQDAMHGNFEEKQTTLTVSTKICPKIGFEVGISKF